RRLDTLSQSLAQIALALYWFHPLAWFASLDMRAERERACDDQVLAAGTKASDYAHELLDIVSSLRKPGLAAALAMARRSQLEGRVLAVLNPGLKRGSVSRKTALIAAALVLIVAIPIAALRPAQQATPGTSSSRLTPALASAPGAASAEPPTGQPVIAGSASTTPIIATPLTDIPTRDVPEEFQSAVGSLNQLQQELADLSRRLEAQRGRDSDQLVQAQRALRDLDGKLAQVDRALQRSNLHLIQERIAQLRTQTEDLLDQDWRASAPVVPSAPAAPASPATPAAPAAPGPPAAPASPAAPAPPRAGDINACGSTAKLHNMNMESHDGYKRWTASWSGDDCSVELRSEGDIQFNADATEIQSIS